MITVKIKPMRAGAILPAYQTAGAAAADLHACLPNGSVCIPPRTKALIPTGLSMEVPEGYEVQVRPRSGIAAKFDITVLNSPGTIDSDYRGEVFVMLINHSKSDFWVNQGDRIGQMKVALAPQANLVWVTEELTQTERGEGGLGSTGV